MISHQYKLFQTFSEDRMDFVAQALSVVSRPTVLTPSDERLKYRCLDLTKFLTDSLRDAIKIKKSVIR